MEAVWEALEALAKWMVPINRMESTSRPTETSKPILVTWTPMLTTHTCTSFSIKDTLAYTRPKLFTIQWPKTQKAMAFCGSVLKNSSKMHLRPCKALWFLVDPSSLDLLHRRGSPVKTNKGTSKTWINSSNQIMAEIRDTLVTMATRGWARVCMETSRATWAWTVACHHLHQWTTTVTSMPIMGCNTNMVVLLVNQIMARLASQTWTQTCTATMACLTTGCMACQIQAMVANKEIGWACRTRTDRQASQDLHSTSSMASQTKVRAPTRII